MTNAHRPLPVILNEAAYEEAIDRRIKENRRIGGERRFRAAFPDAQAIIDFVEARVSDEQVAYYAKCGRPLEDAKFIDACWVGLQTWGGLTEKQGIAVRNSIAKGIERREAFRAERAAISKHIGTVGERRDFTLTLNHIHQFDGVYGTTYIHILTEGEGNAVVYKGSKKLTGEKGETVTFKATIKAHDARDGVAQTILSRPAQK